MGACRALAVFGNGVRELADAHVLSLVTTCVLYVLAGTVAGHVTVLLRRAEKEVSAARAREEVARTLHDGVLQTLAVIERRADDPVLARMARDQERQLRDYIAGTLAGADDGDLGAQLRAAASRFETAYGGRADIALAPDLPRLEDDRVSALAGAAGEAMTNAGKHGAAQRVTVFVEPDADGGVFCSVKDDGRGFDPAVVTDGLGIRASIRDRLAAVGGRMEIESKPGGPTEVRMWLP
jgi:signal transduction histidine kinase